MPGLAPSERGRIRPNRDPVAIPCVKAGEKMHQRAGVKLHQDGMPKASIGGLLLGDKQDEKGVASPENVTEASSVASPPMFPVASLICWPSHSSPSQFQFKMLD